MFKTMVPLWVVDGLVLEDIVEISADDLSSGNSETLISSLVFDYPDENFFDASEKRVQNTIMMAKAGDEPMQSAFSYSEIEKLLEKHGFLIYELLTPDDIQRDIIDKAGADMKAFEHVNYCLAVRKN